MYLYLCVSLYLPVPGEPRRLRMQALNSTAINVQWRPPLENEQNGIIRGYQIFYSLFNENEGSGKLLVLDISNGIPISALIFNVLNV